MVSLRSVFRTQLKIYDGAIQRNNFHKKDPSQIFDWVPNTPLSLFKSRIAKKILRVLVFTCFPRIFGRILEKNPTKIRSSHRWCSVKGVHRNFQIFTGNHLCQSLLFNKVADLTLLKNRLWHKCFRMNFPKFLRTLFVQSTSLWMTAFVKCY